MFALHSNPIIPRSLIFREYLISLLCKVGKEIITGNDIVVLVLLNKILKVFFENNIKRFIL